MSIPKKQRIEENVKIKKKIGINEGRPTKIKSFIKAFRKVLKEDETIVVYLTDNELRISCNDLLEAGKQISQSTFEKRKAGKIKDSKEYQEFLRLYKRALINQKKNLFKEVMNGSNNWQSRSWIIERKFNEWNLRQQIEQNIKTEDITKPEPKNKKLLKDLGI